MKYIFRRAITLAMMVAASLVLSGCMSGIRLDIAPALPDDLKGNYALILYGCRYPSDLENLVILFKEGGPFTFEMYSPETRYRTRRAVPADEALKQAERFLMCSIDYGKTRLGKIVDRDGTVAGFELRPLYPPYKYGMIDVLNVNYWRRDGKVVVYIRLDPDVEKALENVNEPFLRGMMRR
jgi:hypothetical protein